MIIKDNMANMCAKVTSTYMEFTLAFGPKPEFSFLFNSFFTITDFTKILYPDNKKTRSFCSWLSSHVPSKPHTEIYFFHPNLSYPKPFG